MIAKGLLIFISDFMLFIVCTVSVSVVGLLRFRYKDLLLKYYFYLILLRTVMIFRDLVDNFVFQFVSGIYGKLNFFWDVPALFSSVLVLYFLFSLVFLLVRKSYSAAMGIILRTILAIVLAGNILIYFVYGWNHIWHTFIVLGIILAFFTASFIALRNIHNIYERDIRSAALAVLILNCVFLAVVFILNVAYVLTRIELLQFWESRVSDVNVFIWYTLNLILAVKYFFKPRELERSEIPESIILEFELTQREREIARLMVEGCSNAEIADKLFIAVKTVKSHVYNIYQKLDINNRLSLYNLVRSRQP